MAIDEKAKEINDASKLLVAFGVRLREISDGAIEKVGGVADPHPETVAEIKTAASGIKGEWIIARDATNAAFNL